MTDKLFSMMKIQRRRRYPSNRNELVPPSSASASASLSGAPSVMKNEFAASMWALLVILVLAAGLSDGALPFAIQSDDGDTASSYATGMYYDDKTERLYVTGSSYGSFFDPSFPYDTKIGDRDCFFGTLQLPKTADPRGPMWLQRMSFGDPQSLDSCTSIHVRNDGGHRNVYTVGHSLAYPAMLAGVVEEGDEEGAAEVENVSVYGVVLDISYGSQLQGGHVLQTSNMEYPLAVVGAEDGQDLFTISVHSETNFRGSSYEQWLMDQLTLQPDPDVFGSFLPHWLGTNYSATLVRLRSVEVTAPAAGTAGAQAEPGEATTRVAWTPRWTKPLVAATGNGAGTQVTSLLQHSSSGEVLVAGFTTHPRSVHNESSGRSNVTVDGFLATVDPQSGETLESISFSSAAAINNFQAFGMCESSGNSSDVFVAGITPEKGREGSYKTVLVKLAAKTLDVVWSAKISGIPSDNSETVLMYGSSCAVTSDGNLVYVAGTITNGASLSLNGGRTAATSSHGKDDVFVAQLDVSDGSIVYARQVGTSQNDFLARGESIVCDLEGNAMLLVNTKGSFFREKKQISEGITTDVVVFSVSRDRGSIVGSDADDFAHTPEQAQEKEIDEAIVQSDLIPNTEIPALLNPAFANYYNATTSPPTKSSGRSDDFFASEISPDVPTNATGDASSDLVLLIAIAMLVCTIIASTTMVFCLHRSKSKKDKTIKKTLFEAENCENSVFLNAVYVEGSLYKEDHLRYNSDDRSFSSGTTIRPLPRHRSAMNSATLLRLEPTEESFRSEIPHDAFNNLRRVETSGNDNRSALYEDAADEGSDKSGAYESQSVGQFDITELVYRERMKTLSDLGSFSFDADKERNREAEDLISRLMQSYSENEQLDRRRRSTMEANIT